MTKIQFQNQTALNTIALLNFSDGVPDLVLFNVTSLSTTSAFISWSTNGSSNTLSPKTIRYQVKYRLVQTSQMFEQSPLLSYNTTSWVVTGLSSSSIYEFFVVAENSAGVGPLGDSQIPDGQGE